MVLIVSCCERKIKLERGFAMLKHFSIKSLFGRFNYEINFSNDGVNIITGPNGYGKTTILKVLDSIATQKWDYFTSLDFKKINIITSKGEINISKTKDSIKINDVKIPIRDDKKKVDFEDYLENSPFLEILDHNLIYDRRVDRVFTFSELYYRYTFSGRVSPLSLRMASSEDDERIRKLGQVSDILGEVRFISAHRLYLKKRDRREGSKIVSVIDSLPERLKYLISETYNEYALTANSLDSTYPNRLLDAKQGIDGNNEYQELLRKANEKFSKLKEYHLANLAMIEKSEYNEKFSTALKIYFDDFYKKYEVFKPLIRKLDLFKQVINNRFTYKKVCISKEKGFEVVDNKNSRKVIELSDLSSGEQQEIVLFFDLIFNTKPNYILLIDEPEISLHILWQKMFLDDLLEIVRDSSINIIVATHSPQIINNHWDIQYDLGDINAK